MIIIALCDSLLSDFSNFTAGYFATALKLTKLNTNRGPNDPKLVTTSLSMERVRNSTIFT